MAMSGSLCRAGRHARFRTQALQLRTNIAGDGLHVLQTIYLGKPAFGMIMRNDGSGFGLKYLHSALEYLFGVILAQLQRTPIHVADAFRPRGFGVDVVDMPLRADAPSRDPLQQIVTVRGQTDRHDGASIALTQMLIQ